MVIHGRLDEKWLGSADGESLKKLPSIERPDLESEVPVLLSLSLGDACVCSLYCVPSDPTK